MSENELLWFIFVDTLVTNLVINVNYELAIWAAPKLSNIKFEKMMAAASAGVFISSIGNYLFGIVFSNIFCVATKNNNQATKNIGLIRTIFDNFGIYLLVLGFIPVYSKFITLFAGFSRYKFPMVIILVTVTKTLFYAFYEY